MVKTTWDQLKKSKHKKESFKDYAEKKFGIKTKDELGEKIRLLKHKNKIREYCYVEESFGPSVEPKYYWLIDFIRKNGFTVEKSWEKIGASVVSQFFGEMSTRKSVLERRGMEILGSINTVVRSILNLLYDLREFDRRLDVYDNLKDQDKEKAAAAESVLRRIWMDEVDIRKGTASLNGLSQKGLEFITLRDAFMVAKDEKEVEKLEINDRVKRILKGRISEYIAWRNESEKELRMRKTIERAYLVSQINSLKLYSMWAKPYLKAAQNLEFEDVKLNDPDLIQAFDQNVIELHIRAYKKYRIKEWFEKAGLKRSLSPPKTWSDERKEAWLEEHVGAPVYGVLENTFTYRTKPALVSQTQTGGVFRQLGQLTIKFESYVYTKEEFKLLEKQEESEAIDFIEGLTSESLEAMKDDIEKYIEEEEEHRNKKSSEKKKNSPKPILDRFLSGSSSSPFAGGFNISLNKLFQNTKYMQALANTRAEICDKAFNVYDIFKKAHGLLSFPYYPSYTTPKAGK